MSDHQDAQGLSTPATCAPASNMVTQPPSSTRIPNPTPNPKTDSSDNFTKPNTHLPSASPVQHPTPVASLVRPPINSPDEPDLNVIEDSTTHKNHILDSPNEPTHFLTPQQQSGNIPNPWRDALKRRGITGIQRLFVTADGSCAGGSFMLGLSDQKRGTVAASDARSPLAIREFRTNHLVTRVRAWSTEQWLQYVPESLREELVDYRQPCRCLDGIVKTCTCTHARPLQPEEEKDIFISVCEKPNYAVGPIFFGIASIVMQVGVLLLINDDRHHECSTRQVHDFGTTRYQHSMIVLGIYPKQRHEQSHGIGHFETIGLSNQDTVLRETLFPADHPVLAALRQLAQQYSDSKTIDHLRVQYYPYGAHISNYLPVPVQPLTTSARSMGKPAQPQPGSAHRRQRTINISQRMLESIQQENRPVKSKPPCRSLSKQPGAGDADLHQLDSSPSCNPAKRAHSTPITPVTVSPYSLESSDSIQAPLPTKYNTISDAILTNVRQWIRRMSPRSPLAPKVHYSSIPMWTLRCRSVLQSVVGALRAQPMDIHGVITNLCILWMLPAEVFSSPGHSGGGASRRRNRYNRIKRKLSDEGLITRMMKELIARPSAAVDGPDAEGWSSLASALNVSTSDPDLSPRSPEHERTINTAAAHTQRDDDKRCVQRSERLFRLGHSYRALQALTSDTELADLDLPEERETLRALHPSTQQPMPQCPTDAPEIVIDWNWMEEEMRATDNGSAAGPSGCGSNYLSVLAADPHCVHAMAYIVQQIVNNKLPAVIRTLLTTCIVVSLVKYNGGRRPIAIGDIFYRMAARYSLSLIIDKVQHKLAPHQYGIGTPDGCTQIVQSLQHLLKHGAQHSPPSHGQSNHADTKRPLACLSIDMANAFNAIDRSAVLRAVYSDRELSQCWRAVSFGYGQPSLLLMQCDDMVPDAQAFIESQTGVRQGDPLAALLFCLAMHPVYDALAKQVSAGCYAYIDDGHFVGTIEECWRAWEMLPAQLRPLTLSANPSKCELTCFHTDQLEDPLDHAAIAKFRSSPLKLNHTAVKLLGCVIGVSNAAVAAELKNKSSGLRDSQLTAFRRIPLLCKQTGMLALQHLPGTVINNKLRAMAPEATIQHAREYDKLVLKTAHTIIGITGEDGDRYDEQIQSPLNMGGFGLQSAVTTAPAAYLAGAENTLRHSPAFAHIWTGAAALPANSDISVAIDDSIQRVQSMTSVLITSSDAKYIDTQTMELSSLIPESAASFVDYYKTKPSYLVQASITHRIATLSFIARVSEAARAGSSGKGTIARLNSLRATCSSLWLRTLPSDPSLTLTDKKWQWAARLRLGMPVPSIDPACPGCKQTDAYTKNQWHSLTCTQRSNRAITDRHNVIVNILARFCSMMHMAARTEPSSLDHDSNKRPDIQVSLPDITLLGDVTIMHPAAKTYAKIAATVGPEAVGDRRESEKKKKYDAMAEAVDMEFLPIVLYTYGGFHRSALRFITKLADALDPAACLWSRSEFREMLKQQIAIAVQRGTADIMIQDSIRQRDAIAGTRSLHRYLMSQKRARLNHDAAPGIDMTDEINNDIDIGNGAEMLP